MLTNEYFLSSFVFTLGFIAALVVLACVVFVINRVWVFSRPFREWLRNSKVVHLVRTASAAVQGAMNWVKRCLIAALAVLIVSPCRAFMSLLAELGRTLREVPWGICAGVLALCSLPFLMFFSFGVPLPSILGVVAAGSVIGILCAPFSGWRYRTFGSKKAIGVALLTIVGGAWGSSLLVALLMAIASD